MDETLLAVAFVMSQRATCPTARVGCAIALDGRVLATGYVGAPRGMPHCTHDVGDDSSNRPTCDVSVHAEANAVAFAARNGVPLDGSTVFTTLAPCTVCAKLLINVGATRVVCAQLYRDHGGVELLLRAGITVDVLSNGTPAPVTALSEEELDDAG
jgi:dCMP deaminase